ncbi:type I secretion C-terminal target domain-containing protein (plasmid) [Aminobacter sp. UC22_36]|uniref:type I secretion C-terminal target domain-containing protein n=1 Tax=Aminobacter sp. UC22_36 TaxID=3374549 RepID=UPI0037563215
MNCRTLADHGITGLSTSTTPSSDIIDGQQVAGEGTVHYADGSSGTYVEVMLDTILGTPETNQPSGETYVIEGLDVADIIPDYDGGKGDQLDLSALLSGLAPDTDLAAQGYVSVVQNGTDAEVKVDVDGGGDSFQTVAVLENFTAVNEAVKVLFEDNAGTKHQDNI